jgi:XTP/dITP diphosphohydrolase
MRLFAATSNPGKLRDFAWAAQGFGGVEGILLEPLPGLKEIPAPPEDESTFEGNARSKAVYYSSFAPGEWVIADDSGLEVEALHGAPGVHSARYADGLAFDGTGSVDERNNAALLRALKGVPRERRQARYRCVLALARDGVVARVAHGTLEGRILREPQGADGFGYDPLFLLPEFGITMAEAGPEMRLEVSHRGRALRTLLEDIKAGQKAINNRTFGR